MNKLLVSAFLLVLVSLVSAKRIRQNAIDKDMDPEKLYNAGIKAAMKIMAGEKRSKMAGVSMTMNNGQKMPMVPSMLNAIQDAMPQKKKPAFVKKGGMKAMKVIKAQKTSKKEVEAQFQAQWKTQAQEVKEYRNQNITHTKNFLNQGKINAIIGSEKNTSAILVKLGAIKAGGKITADHIPHRGFSKLGNRKQMKNGRRTQKKEMQAMAKFFNF